MTRSYRRHILSRVDTEGMTATCSTCGPVDLRWVGERLRCRTGKTRRATADQWHRLTEIDTQGKRATCSQCGPDTEIQIHGGTVRCAVKERKDNRRRKSRQRYGVEHHEIGRADGRCEACKSRPATNIDHDHKTGEVRGKLCHQCNVALGMVCDSTTILQGLIRYLDRGR